MQNSVVNQVIVANQEKSVNAKIVDLTNFNHLLCGLKIVVKQKDVVKIKSVANQGTVV